MGVSTKKGSFAANTSSGNQAVTGVGFQPDAVILWYTSQAAAGYAAGGNGGFGFATAAAGKCAAWADQDNVASSNATRYHANGCLVQITAGHGTATVDALASMSSLDADGFTINWSNPPAAAIIIHYIAIGGSSVTNAKVGEFSGGTATGNASTTGVGFQPDLLMLFSIDHATALDSGTNHANLSIGAGTSSTARGTVAWGSNDFSADGTCISYHATNKIIAPLGGSGSLDGEADLVSMDADGFTLNWTNALAAASKIFYLALKGGSYFVGNETQKTSTGTKATTGVGFAPTGVFAFAGGRAASASVDLAADAQVIIGGTDGTAQGVTWISSDDAAATMDTNVRNVTTAVLMSGTNPSTTVTEAAISSLDADGFTLNWGTADATARQFFYVAFGPASATVAVGQVTGTDSAQAVSRLKARAIGQAVETAASQPVAGSKTRATAQASATDAAQPVAINPLTRLVSQAAEASGAQAITSAKARAVGQATATEAAQAIAALKARALGQASTADAAQAIARSKARAVGQAVTTDVAQAVAQNPLRRLVGQVAETVAAQALGRLKTRALGQAAGADAAQPVSLNPLRRMVATASETATAQAIGRIRSLLLGQVGDTGAAQSLGRAKQKALGQAVESDAAQPISSLGQIVQPVGQASSADAPQAIVSAKVKAIGQASATEAAQPLAALKAKLIAQAVETASAQPLATLKIRAVGQAGAADSAQGILSLKALTIGEALEASASGALGRLHSLGIGQAAEIETALAMIVVSEATAGLLAPFDPTQPSGQPGDGPALATLSSGPGGQT